MTQHELTLLALGLVLGVYLALAVHMVLSLLDDVRKAKAERPALIPAQSED